MTVALQHEPEWDEERLCWHVGNTAEYRIEVLRMLFNDRIVLTPHHCLDVYDYGWCFDRGQTWLALATWNPDTEAEPPGYKKRIGASRTLDRKMFPLFTCPRCGMTSYNPNDAREGYCGSCHGWTAEKGTE